MTRALIPLLLLSACVDQEEVDEVADLCSDWIAEANSCLDELATSGGVAQDELDEAENCDPINEAAETCLE